MKNRGWIITQVVLRYWTLTSCHCKLRLTPKNPERCKYYIEIMNPMVGHPKKYAGVPAKCVFVCFQPL